MTLLFWGIQCKNIKRKEFSLSEKSIYFLGRKSMLLFVYEGALELNLIHSLDSHIGIAVFPLCDLAANIKSRY